MNIRKRTWSWRGKTNHAYMLDGRVGRRRIRRQFRTRNEAELYRDKLIRERRSEAYGTLLDRITFKAFVPVYVAKKPWKTATYRERVMVSLDKTFVPFHDQYLTDIEPAAIEAFRGERLRTVAPSTVRQDLAALADFCTWAVKLHYLDRNPMAKVERPSLPTKPDNPAPYLTPEAFGDLLTVAGQDAPLYEFAVWTGMRESELLALGWSDLKDGFVTVRLGKGRKQRLIPLVPQAVAALQKVPKRLKEPRVFWWVRSRYQVYKRFRRRLKWAKLSGYRFHDLRHSFASYAAMSGVDIRVIADALGHSQTTVTRRYAHLSPDYRRLELQKMAKAWPLGTREAHEEAKLSKT